MTSPIPDLVGMVHLLALPGAPMYGGSMDQIIETAVSDARALKDGGFPALMVENFGDVPFFSTSVPVETVSAMAVVCVEISRLGIPFGVNVLRNDGIAALGVAAATGADWIRVNVLAGTMYTDQGIINGDAAAIARKRSALGGNPEIWADVGVKHAIPPTGFDIGESALDTVERGLAEAVIISGSGTGVEPDLETGRRVRDALGPDHRVVVGSGANVRNLGALMKVADSFIVGSALKFDGDARNRPDPERVARFVAAADQVGLL